MEKANACNGRWAHRSGVVDRETAPNRADYQHIIGPPPMSEVAENVGVCYESVRRWVDWYRSGGLEEVLSRRHGGSGGKKPRLSEEDREKLLEKAERGELRTISDGVRWAREEAGVEYTYWGMRHVFERLDLKKKVPRQQSPDADPERQEAWKKGA